MQNAKCKMQNLEFKPLLNFDPDNYRDIILNWGALLFKTFTFSAQRVRN
jgi:hypothetical protein